MATGYESYRIWAPEGALWSDWVKPVLFTCMANAYTPVKEVAIKWIRIPEKNTMIVVDLPGKAGVEEGLGLARVGFRPIPLYNGVSAPPGYTMVVPNNEIVFALHKGAEVMEQINPQLHPNAPPAFLLDENRMLGVGKMPGTFDNRWCVFPQDMPSATFLQQQGITRVVVRSVRIKDDLSHILLRYQKQGIDIHLCNGVEIAPKTVVSQPSFFKSASYRFSTIMGLRRNAVGGFGSLVPEQTQASGGRYYGFG